MTVAMTQARRTGARAVACASTGNTSASLAAYAAQAGLPALVFVPAGQVALGKLTQTLAYGARTLLVRGNFDDCLTLARDGERRARTFSCSTRSIRFGSRDRSRSCSSCSISSTGTRRIGSRFRRATSATPSAFGKALREAQRARAHRSRAAHRRGAGARARRRSRRAFAITSRERVRVDPETIATAIRIGAPASWDRAVRTIRETNGVVTSVTDEEILDAKAVIDAAGVGCEPASAASVAGVRAAAARGRDRRDRARRRGAHRTSAQGSGRARAIPSGNGAAAGARESPDRDRAERRARSNAMPRTRPRPRAPVRPAAYLALADRASLRRESSRRRGDLGTSHPPRGWHAPIRISFRRTRGAHARVRRRCRSDCSGPRRRAGPGQPPGSHLPGEPSGRRREAAGAQEGSDSHGRQHVDVHAADGRHGVQLRRARLPGRRDERSTSPASSRRTASR